MRPAARSNAMTVFGFTLQSAPMPLNQERHVEKIRRDHDRLLELVTRIKELCALRGQVNDCRSCQPGPRSVCQGNVEQLILAFVEATLKHHLVESVYMESAPPAHRQAHMRAHMAIAEQLKSIRVVFSADGNCVLAIDGIDAALTDLTRHFDEFDKPLEDFLLAPA